ncbi:MAG: LysR family transcriptional regulator [Actinomycetota bacterium]
MEIRHLATLIAIADHGSFSAAARALGTVQSNVSAHIARLEKELGATLVERTNGTLTEQGAVVVERGRRIIHELQDIEADIHSDDSVVEGDTRIGCIGTTGRWLMPRLLGALAKQHPGIHATIHEGSTSTLVPRLIEGQLDAAIVHFPVDAPELQLEPLFSEDLILLVHEDHEWSKLESISLTELATKPILLAPRNTSLRRIIDRAAGNQRVALTAQAEIDGVRLLASLAFDGFGPAIVPATSVPDWLVGPFARVALPELPKRAVGWATRRRPLPNKATRATFDILRATIARVGDRQPGITTSVSPLGTKS